MLAPVFVRLERKTKSAVTLVHLAFNQGQNPSPNVVAKRGVIVLCLLVSLAAGVILFHWYRIQRTEPAYVHAIPHIKWSHPLTRSYPIWTAPILGKDGTLYVAATDGVYAIDSSSATRWEYRMGEEDTILMGGFFQDANSDLYIATANRVYSLTRGGIKRWQKDCARATFAKTSDGWPSAGELLYTTCGTQFVALQKTDGSQSWVLPDFQTQGGSVIPNAPLMLPNGTFLFDKDEHTVATDRSGTTLWTYPLDSGDGARLVGAAGRSVFAVDLMKGFTVLDASDGSVRWTFNGEPVVGFDSPPAIAADGTIYAVGARGPLFAFAPDGSLNWKFLLPEKTTTGHGYAPPLVGSDGTIYLLLEQAVIAVSSQGKLVWEQKLSGPAIDLGFLLLAADGTLYVVTDTAMVHAVQTASHGPLQNSGGRF